MGGLVNYLRTKRTHLRWLVWSGMLLSQPCRAQSVLSLADALRYGGQYNAEIQGALSRQAVALSNQRLGASARRPTVDLAISQNNFVNQYNAPTTFVQGIYQDNSVNGGLSASWLLYNGGRAAIEQRLLGEQVQQAALRLEETRQAVGRAIVGAYYRAVVETEKLRVRSEAVALSKARWLAMSQQDRLGKASQFDVLQAENLFLTDSTTLLQQDIVRQGAFSDLHKAIGWGRFEPVVLTDSLRPNAQPPAFANLPGKLLSLNFTLRTRRIGTQLLVDEIRLRQTALKPALRLNSSFSHSFTSTKFPDFPRIEGNLTTTLPIGLAVAWPLLPNRDLKRALLQSELERSVTEIDTKGAERRLLADADLLGQSYTTQAQIVALSARLTANAARSLTIARERLQTGFTTLVEYRTMQLAYTEAKLNQLQALYALKLIEADANALIGSVK